MIKLTQKTKNKLWTISTSILIASLLIVLILLILTLQHLDQFKPIATFNIPESEWIKINDAKLYAGHRAGVIFPNDQLILVLNTTNKKPLNIEVKPILLTYTGGKLIESQEHAGTVFGLEHTDITETYYYAKQEGLNLLTVALKISLFNGTFLTFQNATSSFEVLSQSDKIAIDQNNYVLVGIIASAVIGAVTVISLAFSVHYSRKEVRYLEEQGKIEHRPWIGATTMISITKSPLTLTFHYKNYGKLPANNVEEKHVFSSDLLTKEEFVTMLNEQTVPHTSLVLADQDADFTIGGIPKEIEYRIGGTGQLFLAIIIDYIFGENKKGRYGVIFEYRQDGKFFTVRNEWAE